ncbi:MAG: CehA/McbA family metallohydrolase [Telluria sp.]
MHRLAPRQKLLCLAILMAFSGAPSFASEADHREFEATIHAPYQGDANGARIFTLNFDYPHVKRMQDVRWTVELVSPRGDVVGNWSGTERLFTQPIARQISFAGRANGDVLPDGVYKVHMVATARAVEAARNEPVDDEDTIEQDWEISLGEQQVQQMPAFRALPVGSPQNGSTATATSNSGSREKVAATASLPYTIYFGNLHSQTNHSDGGGVLTSCTGAQNPQAGAYGPTDAFTYAMNKGLDFLMASEHNHMYDGSDSTNTSADPTVAHNLYQSGLTAANDFNTAHPNFLAVYGMEWGVITNGGHMNIFNSSELLGWEYNSSNQLIADTYTAKSDYASLYTLMRQRGWVGQFNHPATSGQFIVNGVALGYTADGDQAIALCEVMNSSAFSTNTTETETSRSNYEAACQKALEAGYHVAFSTDQDNHCANWGASYTNRTGVLLPTGATLNTANFIAAIKARRVFATMDKTSQLILTANGHIMGERFSNSGSLNLVANFASTSGKTVSSVVMYEGVPGRNGTVTQLSTTANTTITPAAGEHYYYAKVTQNDGNILWSAPIWVTQGTGTVDTTPPTVSASESGTSGSITFNATASDNVGVSNVEFYVDGTLKATTNVSPYSATLDSTTLTNGSHTLVAKAYDAAGNVGTSTSVGFSVSNTTGGDVTPPTVSASESGTSGTITFNATASDNVGVAKVEFYVDGVLKGTDSASPWTMTLDSTTLSNASHTLVAKAYDAAGNVGTSSSVGFTVSNTVTQTQLITNGGFESGTSPWTQSTGVITNDTTQAAHGGSYYAWLDGYGTTHTDYVSQSITIPSTATKATLTFYLKVLSDETTTTSAYDTLKVTIRNSSNTVLSTLATYSNLNKGTSYVQKSFDITSYKGQTVRVDFEGVEDSSNATSFLIDDVSVLSQ